MALDAQEKTYHDANKFCPREGRLDAVDPENFL